MQKIPSYEFVNYALRPAKQIERKMMLEGFLRLASFESLSEYTYIGFGSIYFVDFSMVHRLLGIRHMTSIEDESDQQKQERFRFNAPFACIKIEFGHSNGVLPNLDWSRRTIAWLDYDKGINGAVFTDVATFCSRARSGSLLAVTVNAQGEKPSDHSTAVDNFFKRIPEDLRPADLKESDVNSDKLKVTMRRLLLDQITKTLDRRNATLREEDRLSIKPVSICRW